MLVKDYSIHCSTERHFTFQILAGVYVAVVALGIPLYIGVSMVRRMREYRGGASDRFVARRVADELTLSDTMAADAIRDCNTGREYSFLVNSFKPRYYFWEGNTFTLSAPSNAFQSLAHATSDTVATLRVRHASQADAGRDAGDRRPRERGAAVPGTSDLVRELLAPGQADALPARRGQRAESGGRNAHLPGKTLPLPCVFIAFVGNTHWC